MPTLPFGRAKTLEPISTAPTQLPPLVSPKTWSPSSKVKEWLTKIESAPQAPPATTASIPAEPERSNAIPTTQLVKNQNNLPPIFSPVPHCAERLSKARSELLRKRSTMPGRWQKGTDDIWAPDHIRGPDDIKKTVLSPVMEVVEGDKKDQKKSSTDPGPRKQVFDHGETAWGEKKEEKCCALRA